MQILRSTRLTLLVTVAAFAAASPALAQSRRNDRYAYGNDRVPPGHRPPAGMCRVWIDGVPPGHQPAPTDCTTAVATRPANARVLFGDRNDAFPGRGNGKWKNTSGNVDPQRIYGTIFTRDRRGGIRNERDDDDRRFENRRDRDDDDRFENRQRHEDDDDRFEHQRRQGTIFDRFDDRRGEDGGKHKNKHKHKGKHGHD